MSLAGVWRHPLSLLVVVVTGIGVIWYVLGLPLPMPASPLAPGERLDCLSYAPEVAGGGEAIEISPARIEADLSALAPLASCIRTFRTGAGLDRVAEIAARHGLEVLQGIDIGADPAENAAEIERAVVIADTNRRAVRAFVVGDRVLSTRQMRASELTAIVRQVRERTKLPVTSAELADMWLDADILVMAVDFLFIRVPLYDARFPPPAKEAAQAVQAARTAVATQFPEKEARYIEAGWPSHGRMSDAARASPADQARALHDLLAIAKRERFGLVLFEGIDVPARAGTMGTAAAHWGLLRDHPPEMKFRWGGAVLNHPLWQMQATMGVLMAMVVFAAAFLAARSMGAGAILSAPWEPVALIAFAGGAFIGWAVADLPVQSHGLDGWLLGIALLLLAIVVPPVCAAAVVRAVPYPGFAAAVHPATRRTTSPLVVAAAAALTLTVLFALPLGLILAFDPIARDIPFAVLTGPAMAVSVMACVNPRDLPREGLAETAAALVLAVAAVAIVFNESFWNWQALWLAAALAALALACLRAPTVRRR